METAKLSSDISLLKQEFSHIAILMERLDITMDKMSEVNTNISQILAVQTSRMQAQEKMTDQLIRDSGEIERSWRVSEKEIYRVIDQKQDLIINEIKQLKIENYEQHKATNEKLKQVERWMWVVTGGAMVVGFIISKVIGPLFK